MAMHHKKTHQKEFILELGSIFLDNIILRVKNLRSRVLIHKTLFVLSLASYLLSISWSFFHKPRLKPLDCWKGGNGIYSNN